MFLFLIFVERPPSDAFDAETLAQYSSPYISKTALAEAVSVVAVALIHFIVVFLVSIVIFARFPAKLHSWAVVLGIFAALLSSVQYVPQIYTTWKLQHVGSLSIPMMCIQTPGGFVFAASLAARLGTAGWSAWSVYLILGTLQGVLLVMAIYFEVRDRRKAQRKLDKKKPRRSVVEGSVWDDDEEEEEEEGSAHGDDDNDDTPLLRDSDSTQRSYHTAQGLSRNVPAVLAPERLIQDSSSSSEPEARNKRQGKRNTK
ncbi:MAG: hypothetical protein M1831_007598 [Alyxoria varia]|nr:MAG: hypothetical protein M1831_007598 [Alyxoria varia]